MPTFLITTYLRFICDLKYLPMLCLPFIYRTRRGRDCMVVGFTTNCAISSYYH